MIICPNCSKRITTIPDKQLTISCTCKVTLRTNGHWLESYSKKATFKTKKISLVYIYGNSSSSKQEFVILDDDNKQMLHLDFLPTWDKLPQDEFEKKLNTYLIFS